VQGGKGTALYVSTSTDHGATWSAPYRFGGFNDPLNLFPPYFNISGAPFRAGGSYPAPGYDPVRNRLYVAYADKDANGRGQVYLTWASASDLTHWTAPAVIAANPAGDRFAAELSVAPNGRIDVMFDDRSYSGNQLVDVTYASSADGGTTWTSRRVTKSGFDPAAYGVPNGSTVRPFLGDYNGIVSFAGGAGMTWTGPGTTYGALPTNLEIYYGGVSAP
jgi:Neuraminidase (sialidase)